MWHAFVTTCFSKGILHVKIEIACLVTDGETMTKPRLDSTCIRIKMNTKSAMDEKAGKLGVPLSLLVESVIHIDDEILAAAIDCAKDQRKLQRRILKIKKRKQPFNPGITAHLRAMSISELNKMLARAKKLKIEPLITGIEKMIELREPIA